jgi:hypothetical protein
VDLQPVETAPLDIAVPGAEGAAVYLGSLYAGRAPLSLDLPLGGLEYVFVESSDGGAVKAIFPAPDALPPAIRASRKPGLFAGLFPPKGVLDGNNLSLTTGAPYDPKEGRVDKARRGAYWAWGGVWVSAITAWLINGHYNAVVNAYNNSNPNDPQTKDFYDRAKRLQAWDTAGKVLVGAAILVDIVQMVRYVNTSGKDAPVFVN